MSAPLPGQDDTSSDPFWDGTSPDPFRRGSGNPTGPANPAADPAGASVEVRKEAEKEAAAPSLPLVFTLEVIDIPSAHWDEWTSGHDLATEGAALREKVTAWEAAGEATVVEIVSICTRSGERARAHSILEMIYPIEYDPGERGIIPVAFETRNVGLMFEIDPAIQPDGSTILLNLTAEIVTSSGEAPPSEGLAGEAPAIIKALFPTFKTQKTSTGTRLEAGVPELLDVWSAFDGGGKIDPSQCRLVFIRGDRVRLAEGAEAPGGGGGSDGAEVTVKTDWIEVETADLFRWINTHPVATMPTALWDDVRGWVDDGRATVVGRTALATRTGQRAKVEMISEVMYPVGWHDGTVPEAAETRNTGMTVEVDTQYYPGAHMVNLNMAPELVTLVRYVGYGAAQSAGSGGVAATDITMPQFYTRKISTGVSLHDGLPFLVGIMSPPDEEGLRVTEKKILLFVTPLF